MDEIGLTNGAKWGFFSHYSLSGVGTPPEIPILEVRYGMGRARALRFVRF